MTRIAIDAAGVASPDAPPRTPGTGFIDRLLGMLIGDATAAFHVAGYRRGRLVTLHHEAEFDSVSRRQGYLA